MEDETEGFLVKWKARLEEEREVQSVTTSTDIDGPNDIDDEASSRGLKLPKTHATYAVKIRASLVEINEVVASEAAKDETREDPSEAVKDAPAIEDAPYSSSLKIFILILHYFNSIHALVAKTI